MSKEKREILNGLPKGWQWKKLSEVAKIIGGGTPSKNNTSFYEDGKIRWATVRDMNVDVLEETELKVSQKAIERSTTKIIPAGNIVIATRVGLGKVCKLKHETAINQDLKGIIANDQVATNYLFFWFKSISEFLIENGTGATVKGIKSDFVQNLRLPLPPLPEQQRIVRKLDALFARIDKAITLAEENLEHLRHLLPAALNEVFEENYEEVLLTSVCQFNPPKSEVKNYNDLEISFVPMADLKEKQMSFAPLQIKPLQEVYTGYTYFKENDVLLAKVTPCFENGKSGIAKNLSNGIGFGSSEYYVFRASDKVLPEWIYYNISGSDFLREGAKNMSGAVGLKRVTKDFINSWKIKLPDLPTQQKIVAYLNGLSAQQQALQSHYTAKLRQLKALKASVLDAAFRGELSKGAEVVEMQLSQVAEEGEGYRK